MTEEGAVSAAGYSMSPARSQYEPFEAGQVAWLRVDDAVKAGIWVCTPDEEPRIHEAEFEMNETVHILEGKVRVEIVGGQTYELSAGDSASFVKGTVGRWKVLEAVKEFFVYSP